MVNENLKENILKLKRERDAVILAHNYQRPEVQLLADYVGDSLDLARYCFKVDAKLVVLAGVTFMAETAAMLNPDKTVVIPDLEAECPLAAYLPAQLIREERKKHPEAEVVLYINTSAEAKAEADVICTSANAPQVVNALEAKEVIFGPDKNLAWYTQRRTDKRIIPLPENGHCYVHRLFKAEDIKQLKEKYPEAEVLVHPECEPEIQMLADHICSTSQMLVRARASHSKHFIIGTEVGMVDRLRREFPEKEFIPMSEAAVCQQMKKHTLEKVYSALKEKKSVVKVDEPTASPARRAIQQMLEISGRATHD
jgi:quinolinate synthase